jgi:hypothetical protein
MTSLNPRIDVVREHGAAHELPGLFARHLQAVGQHFPEPY